jgi:hypothetical protein
MARRGPRRILRTLARHWLEGLVIVGMNAWVVSEVPPDELADALFGDALTSWERAEFERLIRQARS